MSIGQVASVTFPALPGRSFDARVREITPAADPQSRTYRVKLTLAQPGSLVRLGMTGGATLEPLSSPPGGVAAASFTVPSTAIFHEGNSPAVWVLGANDSLELRRVTVRSYSDHSTILSGGLKDGDMVVLAGVHTVYAGQHVTPVRPLFDGEGDVAGPEVGSREHIASRESGVRQ
jgi:multidrug efflux pump subunit AcrA (membrane-fusion protein)